MLLLVRCGDIVLEVLVILDDNVLLLFISSESNLVIRIFDVKNTKLLL